MTRLGAWKENFEEAHGFRPVTREDSERLLAWRNSDHVRHYMQNQAPIAPEQHAGWLERILNSDSDLYFIYAPKKHPIGMLCFNHIADGSAEWGFYLGEQGLPSGTGTAMLRDGLALARENIGLTRITARVLSHNPRSHHLHRKLGFTESNGLFSLNFHP